MLVEYSRFDLWDEEALRSGAAQDVFLGAVPGAQEWLKGGHNKVECACWAQSQFAQVDLRAASAEPPTVDGWEQHSTVDAWFDTGVLRLWSLTAGPASDLLLNLPFPGPVFVRARTRGRDATVTAARASSGDPTEVSGLEQWLIEIWPRGGHGV